MEGLIKDLRNKVKEFVASTQWQEHREGILIASEQALQIADALEVATYPPIVKVAIATIEHLNLTNRGTSYMWATIDKDQDLRLTCNEPVFNEHEQEWDAEGIRSYINIRMQNFHFNTKDMLFQRTPDGWVWVGKPE